MGKINYNDKQFLYQNADIPAENKVNDVDMNEIKDVVNENDDDYRTLISRKDILAIRTTANFKIPNTNTFTKITGFSIMSQLGNKLSFSNDNIVIGSGVKKVKVSYSAKHISEVNATRSFSYLTYNNTNISQEGAFFSSTGQQITTTIAPLLIDVSEGDIFGLAVYGYKDNIIGGTTSFATTCLVVEVVEYED